MTDIALKILIALVSKLMSDVFISKLAIYTLRAWSKTTSTDWDDRVTAAMAEALGVPPEPFKDLVK